MKTIQYILTLFALLSLTMDAHNPDLPEYQARYLFSQPGDVKVEFAPDKILMDNFSKHPYTKEQLDNLLGSIAYMNGVTGMEPLLNLVRSWGPRVDNLNFTDPSTVNSYLAHSYHLVKVALNYQDLGYDILLVEATNSRNVRAFKDIDLLMVKDGSYTFCDVTVSQPHGQVEGDYYVSHQGSYAHLRSRQALITSKLKKLESKTKVDHLSMVVSPVYPQVFNFDLDVKMDLDGKYKDDFAKARNMVELAKNCTKLEMDDVIRHISPRLRESKLEHGLVRSYPELNGVYDALKVSKSLSTNIHSSMKYHYDVCDHIRTLEDSPAHDLYSVGIVDKLEMTSPKSTFYSPCASIRSIDTSSMSMVERADRLIKMLQSKGSTLPPMLLATSLCTDDQPHPTQREISLYRPIVEGPHWGSFTLTKSQPMDGSCEHSQSNFFDVVIDDSYGSKQQFMYGGDNPKGVTVSNDREVMKPLHITPREYELALDGIADSMMTPMDTGGLSDVMFDLISDSMPNTGDTGNIMKSSAHKTMSYLCNTKLMNWIETTQMMSEALTTVKKIAKHYKRGSDGKKKANKFRLFVCEVGNRNAMMFSTASFVSNSATDCSVLVEGDLYSPDLSSLLISRNTGTRTKWFNMSRSDHDWTTESFPNTTSYYTMLSDMTTSLEPKIDRTYEINRDVVFGLGLMLMNNTRFCQVSNEVRHMFTNCAGISNGTMDLYKKLDWYSAGNFVECTYLSRMHKMTTLMQMLKAHDEIEVALADYTSEMKMGVETIGYTKSSWKVALPSISRAMPTDQRLYSSFYTSHAFANNRYNLTFMQSQVLLKQLDSREAYVEYRKDPRATDLRNLPHYDTKAELLSDMKRKLFQEFKGGQHRPCHLTVLLASMNSLSKIHSMKPTETFRVISDSNYAGTNIYNVPTLSSVANNKASVLSRGRGGVLPAKIKKKKVKTKKGERVAAVTETQTAKGYETLFLEMLSFIKDKPLPSNSDLGIKVDESEYVEVERLDKEGIEVLLKNTCKTWPALLYGINKNHASVARMIHKDDQKPREIAVMNMHLRLLAHYIEEVARKVQSVELSHFDYTNLIEQKDKDNRSASTYMNYKGYRKSGKRVIFDNEDKSGWGPSQDPRVMFITLAMRVHTTMINLLGLTFQRYTNKVFKIPDHLAIKTSNCPFVRHDTTNVVNTALSRLQKDIPNVYCKERMCIYAEEGMFQGTLSVSSSCSAADCMRLSCSINIFIFSDRGLDVQGHVTSDDGVRALSFNPEWSYTEMVKLTLHVHNEISKNFSYKRNMSCSVHSTFVFELNSVFHTSDGKIIPSIKSRLSFISYSHNLDMYLSGLDIMSKTSEYVRLETSIMGGYWINLLKTWCHIRQFQLTKLYKEIGKKIFTIPLEIGGLPTIDPILTVAASPISNIVANYCNDFGSAMTFLNDVSKYEMLITDTLTDEEIELFRIKSDIPKMTRNSVTNLMTNECKNKRIIREATDKLPRSSFVNLSVGGGSALKALVQCLTREGVYYAESSLANRFSLPQTPYDAKVYYVSPGIIRRLFNNRTRISRHDMHKLAKSIEMTPNSVITDHDIIDINPTYVDVADRMSVDHENYYTVMNKLKPLISTPILQSSFVSKIADTYIDYDLVIGEVNRFKLTYLPKELGGNLDLHPLSYYEIKNTFTEKLKKLAYRTQRIKFTSQDRNHTKHVAQRLLETNFFEQSSMIFTEDVMVPRPIVLTLHDKLESYLNPVTEIRLIPVLHPMTLEEAVRRNVYPISIDITGLASFGTNRCPQEWGTVVTASQSMQSLRRATNKHGLLEIKGRGIEMTLTKPGFPYRDNMYSLNDIYVAQLKSTDSRSGTHSTVVVKTQRTYNHHVTIWHGEVSRLVSTNNDLYHYWDVSQLPYVSVNFTSVGGISILESNNSYILVLGRDTENLGKAQLMSQSHPDLITRSFVERHLMDLTEDVYEVYRSLSIYRSGVDVAEEERISVPAAENVNALENIIEDEGEDAEDMSLTGDEQMQLFDLTTSYNLGSTGFTTSESEQEDEDHDEDDFEAFEADFAQEEPDNRETNPTESIISGDRDDPTPDRHTIHTMVNCGGLRPVGAPFVLNLRRQMAALRPYVWTMRLPKGLRLSSHHNDEVLNLVMDSLSENLVEGTMEYLWTKYYIIQNVLTLPNQQNRYLELRQRIRDEREDRMILMDEQEIANVAEGLGIDLGAELEELRWADM